MTRDEVLMLFRTWKSAGLRPPVTANAEAYEQMIDAFFGQYQALTEDEVEHLKTQLSGLQYWPRFYDVNECLASYRRSKDVENAAKTQQKSTQTDRDAQKILGLSQGQRPKNYVDALAKKYAALHFPGATEAFVAQNKINLAAQMQIDFGCENCTGKTSKECRFGCHVPYLRVNKYTGECVMLVDSIKCKKHLAAAGAAGYNSQQEGGRRYGSDY